ncbi:MAG: recombination protein RecR [Gammaproteobacteria bacterium]|jgi:recombination protein RecR|nr:recombination protein RecR [Gammaproteobacteria bacterium]
MSESPLLSELIDALRCMPGIGKKSAQRITYHLLQRNRDGARKLSSALTVAMDKIGHCERCRTFSEEKICALCQSNKRDRSLLCIVESPADVYIVEEAGFRGTYFVLMGHLSPLDGIGPEDLGLDRLERLLDEGEIEEVILATSTTVEGEATAHFIGEMVHKRNLNVSRIAHGVPMGGELEFVDSSTLSHAIAGRREF